MMPNYTLFNSGVLTVFDFNQVNVPLEEEREEEVVLAWNLKGVLRQPNITSYVHVNQAASQGLLLRALVPVHYCGMVRSVREDMQDNIWVCELLANKSNGVFPTAWFVVPESRNHDYSFLSAWFRRVVPGK
eukprot:85533-Pelagomonas_calceolata.AAC.3